MYISADRLTDQATQQQYYRVKLTLDPQQLPPRTGRLLTPGMPAEAFIKTSERTDAALSVPSDRGQPCEGHARGMIRA